MKANKKGLAHNKVFIAEVELPFRPDLSAEEKKEIYMNFKRNVSGGNGPVRPLFVEGNRPEDREKGIEPIFSLQEFRKVFIEMEDPTEYRPAIFLVADWLVWRNFKRDWPLFRREVEQWKEEVDMKLRSKAIQSIITSAKEGSVQASTYLANAKYITKKGRKTKEDKAKEDRIKATIQREMDSELSEVEEYLEKKNVIKLNK